MAIDPNLQAVIAVSTAAGLGIDFRETIGHRKSVDHAEFPHHRRRPGGGILHEARDAVCDAPQKQVPSLASHVRDGQHGVAGQLLLDGRGVLQNLLRDLVPRKISPRLELQIRIGDSRRKNGRDVRREGQQRTAGDGPVDAVVLGRLSLTLAQARTVIVTGADPEHRLAGRLLRRPAQSEPRAEVVGLHGVPVFGVVGNERACRNVEPKDLIVVLVQRAVVFVTQSVAHRKIGPDLPFVLHVTDIESLAHMEVPAFARPWAHVVGIAVNGDLRGSVGQEPLNVGEGIGNAA